MVEHGKGNFVSLILSMIKHKFYSCEWIEMIMKRKITILFFLNAHSSMKLLYAR